MNDREEGAEEEKEICEEDVENFLENEESNSQGQNDYSIDKEQIPEVGMQFEGLLDDAPVTDSDTPADTESNLDTKADDEDDEDSLIYTVTDLAEDKVVLDGNHPLAGLALKFWLLIADVREATEEELEDGHPLDAFGSDIEDDEAELEEIILKTEQRPTLH